MTHDNGFPTNPLLDSIRQRAEARNIEKIARIPTKAVEPRSMPRMANRRTYIDMPIGLAGDAAMGTGAGNQLYGDSYGDFESMDIDFSFDGGE